MSDIIDFLERMGADAQLKFASQEQLTCALEDAQIDPSLREAILQKAPLELYALLDSGPLYAMQLPDEDEDEEQDDEDEEENDAPDKHALNLLTAYIDTVSRGPNTQA